MRHPIAFIRAVATSLGLVAILAAVVAAATIWLVLTDPVTVATAVDEGEIATERYRSYLRMLAGDEEE